MHLDEKKTAAIFKAFCDENRIRILKLLQTGEKCACKLLEEKGISAEIVDIATLKPLDVEAVVSSVTKTGAVVCAEEHNQAGGLGELISGVLAAHCPVPVEFVNGQDRFGQSGTPAELMKAYGLDGEHIAEAALKAISRK